MNWYLQVLKRYAEFSGRASRTEFWMFTLVNFIVVVVLSLLDSFIGFGLLGMIYGLGVLIPSLAVSVRRLHDTNRSGWWLLIGLIPVIGFIVLLVFMVQDSDAGDNQYGSNPKGATA
ncbi:MAG TPA: DUF805 domain-containing protein [Burkholderiales bacterium]|jgi:uncharacterized membrane protein YhaH (DUF805 family)|nr:DUF805 domain-containing protein [Burkholderiales bacterium]